MNSPSSTPSDAGGPPSLVSFPGPNWAYCPGPEPPARARLESSPTTAAEPTHPLARNSHRLAFSVAETAEMLGVSEKTVRRLIARRLLQPSRALRHLLIPRSEIERFLKTT